LARFCAIAASVPVQSPRPAWCAAFEIPISRQVDKRFEQVDKRFEQVDRRLDDQNRHMNRWFTVMTVMLGIIGLGVMAVGFLP
jgi:hypothetical protein